MGSLADVHYPSPVDLDYEVFPMEAAIASTGNLTGQRTSHAAGAVPSAPPIHTDSDYEPLPGENQASLRGCSSGSAAAPPGDLPRPRSTPAAPGSVRPPTLEYAVPLVAGKQPDGRQQNQSLAPRPIDVGTDAEEAEYAQPYRASRADSGRRSIPDVALEAMSAGTTGPARSSQ